MKIDKRMIKKKKKRLEQLMFAVYYRDLRKIQRILEDDIKENLGLLETEIPTYFPSQPIKSILEYALKSLQSESAKILIDFGVKIDENIRSIILDQFPTLVNYKKRPI